MGKTLGRPIVRFNRGRPHKKAEVAPAAAPVRAVSTPLVGWASVDGSFDAVDIYDLAFRRAGPRSQFVEVTAGKGRSSSYLAGRVREHREIKVSVVHTSVETVAEFSSNLQRVGALAFLDVRSRLPERADESGDLSLSFVFLDIPPESAERSMAAWWPKVERGGMLSGSGYEAVRGVVDAFVASSGLGHAFRVHQGSWILHKSLTVDAMFCINPAARTDRRAAVEAQFRAAGLADRIEFFEAIQGKDIAHPRVISNGQAGCLASHLGVIAKAIERGAKNILIFEDDVRLAEGFATKLPAALARCPATYDALYVGAICVPKWGNYLHGFDDLLARAGRVGGSHAYMINAAIEPRLRSDLNPMRIWYDEYLMKKVQPEQRCYVCVPYLASQQPGKSDVSGGWARTEDFSQYVYR